MWFSKELWQQLADERAAEATLLLENERWSGAYYLSGYSVECALKAVIASTFIAKAIPEKELVTKIYTHDLSKLLNLAALDAEREQTSRGSTDFEVNWQLVLNWQERSRYQLHDEADARAMVGAVVGRPDGVLEWIRSKW
jgi:HEPN domain-containing protein